MAVSLDGKRVLIVEDEYLLASILQDAVEDLGAEVVGPFAKVQPALQAIAMEGPPDIALLDVNLGTEQSYPVADELFQRSVPVALLTGYDTSALPAPYRTLPCLRKPFDMASIRAMLSGLLRQDEAT